MSYLLYCIFRSPLQSDLEIPAGVGGHPVFIVDHKGLGAGLSELAESDWSPDIPTILAYERVVESFYRHLTVIPIRYGCRLEDPSEAIGLLQENLNEYDALLHELDGLAEMGIQVLLDNSRAGTETHPAAVAPESFPQPGRSGGAYLAAKRLYYLSTDRATLRQSELVETLCSPLSGFFVRRKAELPSSTRCGLLSLYFLVPRSSVESFRQAARQLLQKETATLLLTGPWPPYNFVDSLTGVNGHPRRFEAFARMRIP
jgi:hypothetical protein